MNGRAKPTTNHPMNPATLPDLAWRTSTGRTPAVRPLRSSWIEVDIGQLRRNFQVINEDKPKDLQLLSVVKDEAYGHGALPVAKTALECGATFLALGTLDEAVTLRERRVSSPMLLFGERQESELPWCLRHNLTCCINDRSTAEKLGRLAAKVGRRIPVHLKINTGMNRYGVRWTEAMRLVEFICSTRSLALEGIMSHFSMSDEQDKTFALLQLERFNEVLALMAER